MSTKLIDVYRQAENDLLQKNHEKALAGFATVVEADPNHIWSHFQVAKCLMLLKADNRAFDVYNEISAYCLKTGFPLQGLLSAKYADSLQANIDEVLETIAGIYSLESERIDQNMHFESLPELDAESSVERVIPVDDKLLATATQLARSFDDMRVPSSFPPIPRLSLLPTEAFFPILELLEAHDYAPGETIVAEGDPCESIYFLAHGEVEVHEGEDKDAKTLARLSSGSVFGEMALITDGPRLASAVAIRDSDILSLSLPELETAADDLDDITWAVAKFTRQRFLNNLLVTSPVFSPFHAEQRRDILDRFSSVGVPTDDVIIKEGETGPGLYLILSGEVEVSKFEGGSHVHLATLKEGSILGEISLVRDTPTTATVKATRGGEFLFLAREDFQELVAEHPEIKEGLSELSDDRLKEQRKAISDADLISEDGSVLF